MSEKQPLKEGAVTAVKTAEKSNWGGDMRQRTHFSPKKIDVEEVLSYLTKSQRERLISGYDMKNLARVFEHGDLMLTAGCFLENGLNVSLTARKLYMHRNTLIYRLEKIKKTTGLDLKNFGMAVTFRILHALYEQK